jgi:hypothetical protein
MRDRNDEGIIMGELFGRWGLCVDNLVGQVAAREPDVSDCLTCGSRSQEPELSFPNINQVLIHQI